MCWGERVVPTPPSNSLWHQLSVLQFNSTLKPSTWDSVRSHRLSAQSRKTSPHPTSDANCKSRLSLMLLCCYKSHVPMTLSSGWINLLEQLRELRETVTYVYQFVKGHRWTAKWKAAEGKVWEGPQFRGFFPLGVVMHHTPGTRMCSPTWKLSEPILHWVLWRLHYTRMTG